MDGVKFKNALRRQENFQQKEELQKNMHTARVIELLIFLKFFFSKSLPCIILEFAFEKCSFGNQPFMISKVVALLKKTKAKHPTRKVKSGSGKQRAK